MRFIYFFRVYAFLFFGLFTFQIQSQTTQTFTATGLWTAPNCVTSVNAAVWGAGGGGAGNSTGSNGAGGGTGGGYSAANNISVTPGVTYTVTVGVGGAFGLQAADATADGGDGGDSWFIDNTTIIAFGGGGGSRPTALLGGAGGAIGQSGIGGFATFNGGSGGNGSLGGSAVGGGGGSSAGTTLPGVSGSDGGLGGGAGGVAPAGGGDGGDGTAADGQPGLAPGGGGGGAGANGKGGAGANGQVFLDWTDGLEAQPNMTSADSVRVCTGVALGLTLTDDAPGASTFKWIAADNPNTTGESTSLDSALIINDMIINPTAVDQIITYTVTPTSQGGCEGIPQVVNATITPGGVITLTSAVGTDAQTVCESSPITDITYSVTGGATGAVVSLLPAGITGNYSSGVFTISGNTTITGTVNYIVTTTGAVCGNDSIAGTITIVPATTIVLSSANNTQEVCEGVAIANIVYTVGDSASVTGLAPGLNGTYSASGNSFTIDGTPTIPGVYTYTVTTSGVCPPQNATGTITVDSNAVLTLISLPATANQVVCEGDPITDIVYAVTGSGISAGAVFTSLPAGITVTPSGNTVTIAGSTNVSGVHSFTVTTTGGTCLQDTLIGSFTVNPAATLVLNTANNVQEVCENTPIIDIVYTVSDSATVTGLPTGVTDAFSGNQLTISGTPTIPGVYTYSISTSGICDPVFDTGIITVDSNAVIILTSAPGTDNQTVCEGDPITDITYYVSGGASGAGVSFLPLGINVTFLNDVLTISGSTNVTGTHNFTVTTTGTCVQDSLSGSITVTPTTTILLTSFIGSDNQVVCENQPIQDITYSTGDSATVTALPIGVSGSFSGGVFTISGTPTVAGSYDYTVNTTGACATAAASGTITVNPNAILTLTSAAGTDNQSVCESAPITDITYAVSGGGTGITVSLLPLGINAVLVGDTLTISGATAATGAFDYTVATTGTCIQDTLTGSITVTPTTAIVRTSIVGSDNQIVCENQPIVDITYAVGDSATVTGLPAGVSGSTSGGTFTISGSPSVVGDYSYTVTTAGPCPTQSVTGTITVNPNATLILTSANGTDRQTVCESDPITDITYAVAGGGTGMTVTLLPLGINTVLVGNTLTISGATAATGTFGYTVTSTGTCVQDTLTGSITITPTSAIVLTSIIGSNNQVVCENEPLVDITYSVGDSATVSPLPAGVIGTYAAGVFTISGTPTVAGNYTYTVTTVGACPSTTANGAITVNPDAVLTLTSAVGTDNQSVCENDSIEYITYSYSGGATGVTITPLPLGFGTSISGGVLTIYGATAVAGTHDYTVTTTGTCSQESLTGSITVSPVTAIVLTSLIGTDNQTVCENEPIQDITYSVGANASVSPLPAGITGSLAGGVFTISGSPTVAGNYSYTVTTTGGCPPVSATGTITVNPGANLSLSSAAGTDNQFVCEGDSIQDITYSVTGGGTGIVVTPLPLGINALFVGNTLTISGRTNLTGTFNYTVSTTGTCFQDTLTGSITVSPTSAIVLTSFLGTNNQVVCENISIVDITYSVGDSAMVSPLPAGITGSYANGEFTISGTPTVAGNYTYTVTTVSPCPPVSATGNITVNPDAVLTLTSAAGTDAQSVCAGDPIVGITYAVSGGGTGATVTLLPIGINATFSGNTLTISGSTNVAGVYDYTVTSTGTCAQDTLTGSITINSPAGISLSSAAGTDNQTLCQNNSIVDITYAITGGGASAIVTALPLGVSGSIAAGVFTISGAPSVPGAYSYTVSTTGTCPVQTASGTITVDPDASIVLSSAVGTDAQQVCESTPITDITYEISGGGTDATVSGLPAGITGSILGGTFTISGSSSAAGTYAYTVVTTGTCEQDSLSGTIIIDSPAGISLSSTAGTDNQTICENDPIVDITYSITGSNPDATVSALPSGLSGSMAGSTFTIAGTPLAAGIYTYTVSTNNSCPVQTAAGTVTVDSNAVITLTSAIATDSQNVCTNVAIADITYSIAGGGTGATVSALPAGVTGSFSGNVFTITGTPTVAGTTDYTVTTTGTCTQKIATGSISVNNGTSMNLSSAVGSDAQTICANTRLDSITYAVTGGGTGATVTALPAGVNGTYANGTFTIIGKPTAAGTTNYTVTTTGTCPQQTLTGSITVDPAAGISLTSAVGTDSQTVCRDSVILNIEYTITGGGTGAGVSGLPTGVSGTFLGGVFTIAGTPTEAGTFPYTVIPTGTCVKDLMTGTLVVNPDAAIALSSAVGTDSQTVCIDSLIVDITYSLTDGADSATVTGLPLGVNASFASGMVTISGNPSVAGTHNYTLTTLGTCTQVVEMGSITVTPDAAIALTSVSGTDSQNVCVNTPITDITYAITGGGNDATVSELPIGVTGTYAAGIFTISGTPISVGSTTYTITTSGNCVQTSISGSITADPDAALVLASEPSTENQSICINTPLENIVYFVSGGGDSATVAGLPSGLTGSYAVGALTISGSPTVVGVHNYTVTTIGTCTQKTAEGSITVNPDATIALSSAIGTDAQSPCLNTAITPIRYTVGGGGTDANVAGLPDGFTSAFSGGVFTITGTPTVVGSTTYTVTTTGTCEQVSTTGTITVVETTISLSSAGETAAQTHCSFNSISDIMYAVGGTATGATISSFPADLDTAFAAGVYTISGTLNNLPEGNYTYTVTTTGGKCASKSETFSLTIANPVAEFVTEPSIGKPGLIVYFNNSSANSTTYNWDFDNGFTSTEKDTLNTYPTMGDYEARLIASNNSKCPDTAYAPITIYKVVVANVFSPNGDLQNDLFKIDTDGIISIQVEIYNRWGLKMYEWSDLAGGWDGKNMQNVDCPDGTYYYIIKTVDLDRVKYDQHGFITLIR